MNRRSFLKLLSAAVMVPVIGLPAVAPGAPAVKFTRDELAKIAEECLVEIEVENPFDQAFRIFVNHECVFVCKGRHTTGFGTLADALNKARLEALPDCTGRKE